MTPAPRWQSFHRRLLPILMAGVLGVALAEPTKTANPPKPSPPSPARIVVLGDSLTEGYGIAKEEAFPAVLETKLREKGRSVEVINAGISGSTTASGEKRLLWQLKTKPQILILALGANDGLRGIKVEDSRKNLERIVDLAQKQGVKVIVAGMLLPPNYGEPYRKSFEAMFREVARGKKATLLPFLLEGVAAKPELNLPDGIHPNAEGHKKIADTVLPYVLRLL